MYNLNYPDLTELKELPEFPDYLIGNDGSVWSSKSGITIKKSLYIGNHKYLCVSLRDANKKKCTKLVHRLVAEAFLCEYKKELHVNHLDFDRLNNAVSNLQMVTLRENLQYSRDKGRYCSPENSNFTKLSRDDVVLIKEMLLKKVCQRRIGKVFNVHYSTISAINCGKSWSHL